MTTPRHSYFQITNLTVCGSLSCTVGSGQSGMTDFKQKEVFKDS